MKAFHVALIAAALSLGSVAAHAESSLTDQQIAHVAYTAGAIDIKAGKQALATSRTPEVREFAMDMVREHTAANKKARALVRKLGVKRQDNATSQQLAKDAAAKYRELAALRGPAFDRAYAANELAYHQTVTDALRTLIPSAHDAKLRTMLQTGLQIFEAHQQHADMLNSMMMAGTM